MSLNGTAFHQKTIIRLRQIDISSRFHIQGFKITMRGCIAIRSFRPMSCLLVIKQIELNKLGWMSLMTYVFFTHKRSCLIHAHFDLLLLQKNSENYLRPLRNPLRTHRTIMEYAFSNRTPRTKHTSQQTERTVL